MYCANVPGPSAGLGRTKTSGFVVDAGGDTDGLEVATGDEDEGVAEGPTDTEALAV
jgi:hypothetical protein